MTPFDFVNAITYKKQDMMVDEASEKLYQPYLINKALSYFPDTLFYANEMNIFHFLENKLQFHFFLNSIRPAKRFAKWVKKQNDNDLVVIMEYYGYNPEKARQALSILTIEQIESIKQKLEKGGYKNEHSRDAS